MASLGGKELTPCRSQNQTHGNSNAMELVCLNFFKLKQSFSRIRRSKLSIRMVISKFHQMKPYNISYEAHVLGYKMVLVNFRNICMVESYGNESASQ